MKMNGIFKIMVMLATFSLVSCSDEDDLKPSESLGIPEMFSPAADADARVKEMYNDYGLWVRMDFTDWHEVTNAYLYEDVNNRMGATMIDDTCRENAIIFSQTLLSNVSKEFAKAYFPLELFFVKTYNGSWWAADYAQLGRSRFVLCWPNQMEGALPVTKEANPDYYYQDSLISGLIWKNFGTMIAQRFDEPIKEFVLAGKAYDNGEAYDNIREQYQKDGDEEKYDKAIDELCKNGGFLSGAGSGKFTTDFGDWLSLLVMEAYDNIKKDYLDNSIARTAKYKVIVEFFKKYNWDIQAAGNKFRQKYNEYKATLPPPVEDDEEE